MQGGYPMTIYIDVLIILNVYVNFFLLRITAKLTGAPLKPVRCAAASFYGSLFSLLILAPQLPLAVNTAIKLAAAVTVVIAAFGLSFCGCTCSTQFWKCGLRRLILV